MAGNYGYGQLPPIRESHDLADSYWVEQPLNDPSPPPPGYYSPLDIVDTAYESGRPSSDTTRSSTRSSANSFSKLKSGWDWVRTKSGARLGSGYERKEAVPDIQPTRVGRGIWKDQLLVDRSLRTMAGLTTLFAIAMIVIVASYLKLFINRPNKKTSSVGGDSQKCSEVTHANTAFLLLINVAATMILGMSNTYQQLVTSLSTSDLKHMLQKYGDSRVGTNSPLNINHKRQGKTKAWAAWLFLVCTSLPVHFLANSLIGPSYIMTAPMTINYETGQVSSSSYSGDLYSSSSFLCWSAFRTGQAHLSSNVDLLVGDTTYGYNYDSPGTIYGAMTVRYERDTCEEFANSTVDVGALESSLHVQAGRMVFSEGNCTMGEKVSCYLKDEQPAECRLNVRMTAAFVLMSCLIGKAVYMLIITLLARGKLRQQCLTFGDIIVASALDPELRVHGECMVNANESYRTHTSHVCHKHCRSSETSITGDEIGHCQKCQKHNVINKLSNQPQPTITTKIKRGLISNLGNTALTQICILMLCSMAMLGGSIVLGVVVGAAYNDWSHNCKLPEDHRSSIYDCSTPSTTYFAEISGGFGGFNRSLPLTSLPHDSLQNEMISFSITNGAQFIYSLLYIMLIYNITLISQEHDWGKLETERSRLRCTIVKGDGFTQNYLLQLPKKLLFPIMAYSILTHWMIGEALQAQETIWRENSDGWNVEHSNYTITYAAYPLWIATALILFMTGACWWAFTYKREGFIPQMFGSIRTLCAATTSLDDFPAIGVQWGDLGLGEKFRHAGLSAADVLPVQPNELYAGKESGEKEAPSSRATGVEHKQLKERISVKRGKENLEEGET